MELISEQLLRHTAIIGASGSGKTVFAKQIIEDATLKGITCIAFDTQGDLASMRLGGHNALGRYIGRKSQLWIPGYNCATSPFALDKSRWAESIGAMLQTRDGESINAIQSYLNCFRISDMREMIRRAGYFAKQTTASDYAGSGKLGKIRRALNGMSLDLSRATKTPLRIDNLLTRKGLHIVCGFGRDLTSQEHLLAFVAQATYDAMLANPGSGELRALLFIDEIAPFLPPVRKTAPKQALTMLVRQARKYGIGIIIATQSPGDVDYKALANFSTMGLGKLVAPQDLDKVRKALQSRGRDKLTGMLPTQPTGQFYKLYGADVQVVNTRWLHTQHRALSIAEARSLADERKRDKSG
jgi:hypothetical protein